MDELGLNSNQLFRNDIPLLDSINAARALLDDPRYYPMRYSWIWKLASNVLIRTEEWSSVHTVEALLSLLAAVCEEAPEGEVSFHSSILVALKRTYSSGTPSNAFLRAHLTLLRQLLLEDVLIEHLYSYLLGMTSSNLVPQGHLLHNVVDIVVSKLASLMSTFPCRTCLDNSLRLFVVALRHQVWSRNTLSILINTRTIRELVKLEYHTKYPCIFSHDEVMATSYPLSSASKFFLAIRLVLSVGQSEQARRRMILQYDEPRNGRESILFKSLKKLHADLFESLKSDHVEWFVDNIGVIVELFISVASGSSDSINESVRFIFEILNCIVDCLLPSWAPATGFPVPGIDRHYLGAKAIHNVLQFPRQRWSIQETQRWETLAKFALGTVDKASNMLTVLSDLGSIEAAALDPHRLDIFRLLFYPISPNGPTDGEVKRDLNILISNIFAHSMERLNLCKTTELLIEACEGHQNVLESHFNLFLDCFAQGGKLGDRIELLHQLSTLVLRSKGLFPILEAVLLSTKIDFVIAPDIAQIVRDFVVGLRICVTEDLAKSGVQPDNSMIHQYLAGQSIVVRLEVLILRMTLVLETFDKALSLQDLSILTNSNLIEYMVRSSSISLDFLHLCLVRTQVCPEYFPDAFLSEICTHLIRNIKDGRMNSQYFANCLAEYMTLIASRKDLAGLESQLVGSLFSCDTPLFQFIERPVGVVAAGLRYAVDGLINDVVRFKLVMTNLLSLLEREIVFFVSLVEWNLVFEAIDRHFEMLQVESVVAFMMEVLSHAEQDRNVSISESVLNFLKRRTIFSLISPQMSPLVQRAVIFGCRVGIAFHSFVQLLPSVGHGEVLRRFSCHYRANELPREPLISVVKSFQQHKLSHFESQACNLLLQRYSCVQPDEDDCEDTTCLRLIHCIDGRCLRHVPQLLLIAGNSPNFDRFLVPLKNIDFGTILAHLEYDPQHCTQWLCVVYSLASKAFSSASVRRVVKPGLIDLSLQDVLAQATRDIVRIDDCESAVLGLSRLVFISKTIFSFRTDLFDSADLSNVVLPICCQSLSLIARYRCSGIDDLFCETCGFISYCILSRRNSCMTIIGQLHLYIVSLLVELSRSPIMSSLPCWQHAGRLMSVLYSHSPDFHRLRPYVPLSIAALARIASRDGMREQQKNAIQDGLNSAFAVLNTGQMTLLSSMLRENEIPLIRNLHQEYQKLHKYLPS